MEFEVARLQEIVGKIQYFCKLHFKNAVDVSVLLETEGLEIEDVNKLIGAGVRKVGFSRLEQYLDWENMLLPCERHYVGDLENEEIENFLEKVLANFPVVESLVNLEQVRRINQLNARVGRVTRVLMRVNVISEVRKFGFLPMEVSDASYEIALMPGVRLIGINAYVPEIGEKLRKTAWRKAGTLFKIIVARLKGVDFFSLNFSEDLKELIGEGVNELRIGLKTLE